MYFPFESSKEASAQHTASLRENAKARLAFNASKKKNKKPAQQQAEQAEGLGL